MDDFLVGFIGEKISPSECAGYENWTNWGYDFDCGYETTIDCDDCKYGGGRKDPEARCNQLKGN